jgi:hypothetical protein
LAWVSAKMARQYRRFAVRSKYQSKWYRRPLAVTIYVNANELRFLSHSMGSRLRESLHIVRALFHPRG